MQYILITGIACEEKIRFLLKEVFHTRIQTQGNKFELKISNNRTILVNCNLLSESFSLDALKTKCNQIRHSLIAIICLDTLNPRPEHLEHTIEILENIFCSNELNKKIYLFFTNNQTPPKTLITIRNEFLRVDNFFNRLHVKEDQKSRFVSKRIWLLERMYLKDLKKWIS